MSTAAQIARDIRSSSSYATEAVVENLFVLGYSRTGRPTKAAIMLDIQQHEGEFTPDHVAEYLNSLGYSRGPRMTADEIREAFDRGTARWRERGPDMVGTLELFWAEELGIKVVRGTRIPGGI